MRLWDPMNRASLLNMGTVAKGLNKHASSAPSEQGEVQFTAGLPRFEALRRVAFLLEDLAAARQQHSAYADALAFRLLALQVDWNTAYLYASAQQSVLVKKSPLPS